MYRGPRPARLAGNRLQETDRRGERCHVKEPLVNARSLAGQTKQSICSRVAILKEGEVVDIKDINEMRANGYKKAEVVARRAIPRDYFDLDGIADYRQSDETCASFIFHGDVSLIMDRLARLPLRDVFIQEPALEEIFLYYYDSDRDYCCSRASWLFCLNAR